MAGLPIHLWRDDILAAVRDHQVIVVAGETGSGKSTQLPQMCLDAGRGTTGMIGHTQPRRIAARAVAERVAEEFGTHVGGLVGYAVRFTDRVGRATKVKVMTDGILLNEVHRDRELARYDTIIIDEAHERSLNIDFLLGYLHRLLPRRPDLRVVITSATIDTERVAAHFGDAPIISGTAGPSATRSRSCRSWARSRCLPGGRRRPSLHSVGVWPASRLTRASRGCSWKPNALRAPARSRSSSPG